MWKILCEGFFGARSAIVTPYVKLGLWLPQSAIAARKCSRFKIEKFMETTDIEEGRKLSNEIKQLATDIVNLRKVIKGAKQVRREAIRR